jgi:hypothetical protein
MHVCVSNIYVYSEIGAALDHHVVQMCCIGFQKALFQVNTFFCFFKCAFLTSYTRHGAQMWSNRITLRPSCRHSDVGTT